MVKVIDGVACHVLYGGIEMSAQELRALASELDAKNAELASLHHVTEVYRSDHVTVYRREDGHEAVLVGDNTSSKYRYLWASTTGGYRWERTREIAEYEARAALARG